MQQIWGSASYNNIDSLQIETATKSMFQKYTI
jgi:hypothetical protein